MVILESIFLNDGRNAWSESSKRSLLCSASFKSNTAVNNFVLLAIANSMSEVMGTPGCDIPLTPCQVPIFGIYTPAEIPLMSFAMRMLSIVFCNLEAKAGLKAWALIKGNEKSRVEIYMIILFILFDDIKCIIEYSEMF